MKTVPFEQVILRGCGIDVHKDMVVATISGEGLKLKPAVTRPSVVL